MNKYSVEIDGGMFIDNEHGDWVRAIDVAPLEQQIAEQAAEIERLKKVIGAVSPESGGKLLEYIAALEAENQRLKIELNGDRAVMGKWAEEIALLKCNLANAETQWKRVLNERDELEMKLGLSYTIEGNEKP